VSPPEDAPAAALLGQDEGDLLRRIGELKAELGQLHRALRGPLIGKLRVLCLLVEGERFAVALEAVQRVVWVPRLAPVQDGRPGVIGVLNLGGEPVLTLELRRLLGRPCRAWTAYTPLVVLQWGEQRLGLVADELAEVVDLVASPPDPALAESPHFASYCPGPPPVTVLDHAHLLEEPL
jgi:chemotaxis signal transduction protein